MALNGTYELLVKSPLGNDKGTMEFQTHDKELTGSGTDQKGEVMLIESGNVNGDEFTFKTKLGSPFGRISVEFVGTADGDSITGDVKSGMGNFTFTGKKI